MPNTTTEQNAVKDYKKNSAVYQKLTQTLNQIKEIQEQDMLKRLESTANFNDLLEFAYEPWMTHSSRPALAFDKTLMFFGSFFDPKIEVSYYYSKLKQDVTLYAKQHNYPIPTDAELEAKKTPSRNFGYHKV